jgi:hypothetical protein
VTACAPLVFLIAGQSNVGLWWVTDVAPAPEDAAFCLAAGQWTAPVASPADPTLTRFANGPGMAFGRALARAGHDRLGFAGCMWGGSLIAEWCPGQAAYDAALALVRGLGVPLAGVLFAQGEADANTAPRPDGGVRHPQDWAAHVGYFVGSLRADLGQPDLPVVLSKLAHPGKTGYANWAQVRLQQDRLALPRVVAVESEPATIHDQLIHLDDPSYAAVGERMAAAYLALLAEAP